LVEEVNKIFLVDLFVDVGEHLTESGSELFLNFDQVRELLNLVGPCPDGRRGYFIFEFVLDLLGKSDLLRHLINGKRYCLDINIDEFLLKQIDSFIQVIVFRAVNYFLEDEPFVNEDLVFLFKRFSGFALL
jgi:hypothetical protein